MKGAGTAAPPLSKEWGAGRCVSGDAIGLAGAHSHIPSGQRTPAGSHLTSEFSQQPSWEIATNVPQAAEQS